MYIHDITEKNGCKGLYGIKVIVMLFLIGLFWTGCSVIGFDDDFAEEYEDFYVDELQEANEKKRLDHTIRGVLEYKGKPPSGKWDSLDSSKEIQIYNPAIMRLLLKRGLDRYIIVRTGKQEEYGVSEVMELLDPEFGYLVKMGKSGDFMGKQEISVSNKLFKYKSFYLYDIRETSPSDTKPIMSKDKTFFIKKIPGKTTKKNIFVMIKGYSEITFFELYTTVKHYPEDFKDFVMFLESVKRTKDTIDSIKEKAKQN